MPSSELERLAASVLMFGFDGHQPTKEARSLIARGASGAILFKRNIGTPADTFALTDELRREAKGPFLLAVDQEGGRVARLRDGFTAVPPLRRIGEMGSSALAEAVGRVLGRECRAAGFDVDFAPVVDVDSNPSNPVIGDRSFSPDPVVCGRLGAAMIGGMQAEGIAACAKHFPGHGDTHQDSHHDLPRLTHDIARLRAVEWPPFVAAVRARVMTVMTAHVVFEALDPVAPATLSPKALGLLRHEIGFEGVVVSDDLEMAAIAERMSVAEAAPLAIAAGCDLLLVCHRIDRQEAVIEAVARYAGQGSTQYARLVEASQKVAALAKSVARVPGQPFDEGALRQPDALELAAKLESTAGSDPTEAALVSRG